MHACIALVDNAIIVFFVECAQITIDPITPTKIPLEMMTMRDGDKRRLTRTYNDGPHRGDAMPQNMRPKEQKLKRKKERVFPYAYVRTYVRVRKEETDKVKKNQKTD